MKKKILLPLLLAPGILLGACSADITSTPSDGSSSTAPTAPSTVEKPDNSRVNSYLVEADGVTYRCFDMGYHGGLWCTVRGS